MRIRFLGGMAAFFLFSVVALASLAAPFSDVSGEHRNALAISLLKSSGVVSGDGQTGLFQPARILNRAEFAKMIVVAKGWSVDDVPYRAVFPDLADGQWYTNYMLKAQEMGVLKGTGEGKAEPGRQVLMVEALAMTLRAYGVSIPAEEPWYAPYIRIGRLNYVLDENPNDEHAFILTAFDRGFPRAEAAQMVQNALDRFAGDVVPEVTYDSMLAFSSSAFQHNGALPSQYTCDGADINPPLAISGVPSGARSLALIVDDPDAPGGTWDHWVLWNIPPTTTTIGQQSVPNGAVQGMTSFDEQRYGGPCPPSGTHRYFFKLYALDVLLNLPASSRKSAVEAALQGHVLGQAELIGLYGRE